MIFDDFGKIGRLIERLRKESEGVDISGEDIIVDDFCFFTRALKEGLAKEEDKEGLQGLPLQ